MKSKTLILSILSILLATSYSFTNRNALEIYVSPMGKDSNPGTIEAPFATAERARQEVRIRQTKKNKAVIVYFRDGVYRFSEPFVLTADDSGKEGREVQYKAYRNEKVVFSGSRQLSVRWEKFNDKLYVASAKLITVQGFSPRTLYVNGVSHPLARYPNLVRGKRPFGGVASDCISPGRLKGWKSPEGAYIHGMQQGKWGSIHYRLNEVTKSWFPHIELISINTSTMYNNALLHRDDRYVENVFEELDAPGEWFWDKATDRLFFYPPEGLDMNDAIFEVPETAYLVKMEGMEEKPVKYVTFSSIHFEKTRSTWFQTTEHLPLGDYVIHRGAAVYLEGTENCSVADCSFQDIGSNAIMLSNYNRYSIITGNRLENIQANGIVLLGSRDAMRDSPWCEVLDSVNTVDLTQRLGYMLSYHVWKKPLRDSHPSTDTVPGPKTENYPRFCTVDNNLISRAGELEKQAAGILLSMCAENTISHNSVYDLPRAGICINDGCWGGNIIEYNDVFHTVLSTADHGPFNSWGRDRHWTMAMHGAVKKGHEKARERSRLDTYLTNIIRQNRFTHTIAAHSWGIDLDDGSSNYHIYNNLTIGCSVKLREGFYRTVENNIFIGKFPPGKHVCFEENEDVIRRNIYVNTTGTQVLEGIHALPSQIKEMDSNLYYIVSGEPATISLRGVEEGYAATMPLSHWQEKGHDIHSAVVDPLFVDMESYNFKLQNNSPAFDLGFKEFDLDNFGVTKRELMQEAQVAYTNFAPKLLTKKNTEVEGKRYEWMGATIKSMTTEGEKSVAGIDDIKGVIIETVPWGSNLFNQKAQPGDVILKANNIEIRNIEDLKKVLEQSKNSIVLWVDGNPPARELVILNPENIK